MPNVDNDVEHLEYFYTASRNVKCYNNFGKHFGNFLKRRKIYLLYNLAFPFLGI